MDLQNNQMGKHKSGCDFSLYTKLGFHKYLDMDLNTFDSYKLCPKDILN